jgi:hypothetical protein
MWSPTIEVVGIAWPEDAPLIINGYLETTAEDNAALFTIMHERHATGVGARLVPLL